MAYEYNEVVPEELSPRVFRWSAAADSYEPTRSYVDGVGIEYDIRVTDERGVILLTDLVGMFRAVFILDDGRSTRPMYVAGWQPGNPSPLHPEGCEPFIILHPFPTDYTASGERKERADGRGYVNYSTWMLGPRKAWHLKVTYDSI